MFTVVLDYTFGGTTMDGHNSLLNLANRSGTCPRNITVGQVHIRCNADLRASTTSGRFKFTLIFYLCVSVFLPKLLKNKLLLIYMGIIRCVAWPRRTLTSNIQNISSLNSCKHV